MYISVVMRHAPLKDKRVKHPELPPGLNKDVMQLMAERDKLKKNVFQVQEAKKIIGWEKQNVTTSRNSVSEREKNNKKTKTNVECLNTFTKGSQSHSADIPKNLTVGKFSNHFLSVAESLEKPQSDDGYHSEC